MHSKVKEMFKSLKMEFMPKLLRQSSIFIKKPRLLIWMLICFIFFGFCNFMSLQGLILSLAFYLLLITFALSDFSEWLVRRFEDVRHVATKKEKERLIPLFHGVYENVKEQSKVSDQIQLYIVDQMIVNAFAIGKNTIVVSRGLMSTMNDEEIKGVLAHEFAHIANGDTQVNMLIAFATNMYLWLAIFAVKLLSLIEDALGANSFFGSLIGFVRSIIEIAVNYVILIITLLVSSSSRKKEYKADMFAEKIGYGEPLLSALYKLYDMEVSDKKKLMERIQSSHPKIAYRIEMLENAK